MSREVSGLDDDPQQYLARPTQASSVDPTSVNQSLVNTSNVQAYLAKTQTEKAAPFLNAAPAPKKEQAKQGISLLDEERGIAYSDENTAYTIKLVVLDGFRMEKATGYDFLLMRRAAFRESQIVLRINNAFRTMEDQQRIYAERSVLPGSKKGPAAKPGRSNHQQGLSLDIHTGIAYEDWKAGTVLTSPQYAWLAANAARFGFNQRDLGIYDKGKATERRAEPWHWTHTADEVIHGIQDSRSDLSDAYEEIATSGDATAFNADGTPDLFRVILKASADYASGWARSAQSFVTSRSGTYGQAAAHQLLAGSGAAQRSQVPLAHVNEKPPVGFAGSPPLYDFDLGVWSDELSEEKKSYAKGV